MSAGCKGRRERQTDGATAKADSSAIVLNKQPRHYRTLLMLIYATISQVVKGKGGKFRGRRLNLHRRLQKVSPAFSLILIVLLEGHKIVQTDTLQRLWET